MLTRDGCTTNMRETETAAETSLVSILWLVDMTTPAKLLVKRLTAEKVQICVQPKTLDVWKTYKDVVEDIQGRSAVAGRTGYC